MNTPGARSAGRGGRPPHRPRRAAALGRRRSSRATAVQRAQPAEGDRAGRDHGGDVDRRRRVARRSGGGGQVLLLHLPDRHRRHRPAGHLQSRGDPLHALHRRADLRRHHAAAAGAEVLGRVLLAHRILPARLAGARRQRRGHALRRVDGPHAGRSGSGHAVVDRHRAHPLRRRSSCPSAAPSSACSSTSPGRCSAVVFLFLLAINVAFVPFVALGRDVHRLLQLLRPAEADRLGPDRRAGRHGGIGRHRQPHGHQLGPRQGLRHGLEGRRDPQRRRRRRDQVEPRRHGVPCHRRQSRALARVAALRARRSDLGVGPVLLPRHVPERQPRHRDHSRTAPISRGSRPARIRPST